MPPLRSPEGFIFGCTTETENECRRKKLFGLPASHREAVLAIRPGATLFLYNYDLRVGHLCHVVVSIFVPGALWRLLGRQPRRVGMG